METERGVSYKAAAKMWRDGSDKGEMGIVEVGVGRDSKGRLVVYHLMFRPVLGSELTKGVGEKMDAENLSDAYSGKEVERMEEMKGFERQGRKKAVVRCRDDSFEVSWEDPKDISRVVRRLVVFRRPERIEVPQGRAEEEGCRAARLRMPGGD